MFIKLRCTVSTAQVHCIYMVLTARVGHEAVIIETRQRTSRLLLLILRKALIFYPLSC